MYIGHIHYSDATVFTASYQEQETDSCSHTFISVMELTTAFVFVMNR